MDILIETQNLVQRFQQGGAFRGYIRERLILVLPALAIFLLYSLATTAGTVITLGGTRSFLVFVGLISAPVILLGSMYFLVLVFFLWLENRAIAHATHHIPATAKQDVLTTHASLGKVLKMFPPAILAVGAAFLLIPLAFLYSLSGWWAFLVVVLVLAVPAAISAVDR